MSQTWLMPVTLALNVALIGFQLAIYVRLKRNRRILIEMLGVETVRRIEERQR